jgi:hypothetical protein
MDCLRDRYHFGRDITQSLLICIPIVLQIFMVCLKEIHHLGEDHREIVDSTGLDEREVQCASRRIASNHLETRVSARVCRIISYPIHEDG